MARFNTPILTGPQSVNAAGGKAYGQSPELELVSLVLTSFANDAFYASASAQWMLKRLKDLIGSVDPLFAAKALVFARDEFGMRSITHAGAALLSKRTSGLPWATDFYKSIVVRPDDMTEILSFGMANKAFGLNKGGVPKLPAALKKGFAEAIGSLNPYQISKYRGEGKAVNLMDVVNLVHPKQTERNAGALTALMKGELVSTDTWESMLSKAGSDPAAKAAVWTELLNTNQLGYFALLRNLRNIANQAPGALDMALTQLKDPARVGKSRVLPFRYQTAYSELMGHGIKRERDILWAIDEAAELALKNVPKLPGKTLVALDTSGSMQGKPIQIGAMFAAVLAKSNDADMLTFSDHYAWNTIERMGVLPMARAMKNLNGGTNFNLIFQAAEKKYDRVIVLSDGEAWMGPGRANASLNAYRKKHSPEAQAWFFDLSNQSGTMQFPESTTRVVAGFSEKVLEIMGLLEADPKALVNKVKSYEFVQKEAASAE